MSSKTASSSFLSFNCTSNIWISVTDFPASMSRVEEASLFCQRIVLICSENAFLMAGEIESFS